MDFGIEEDALLDDRWRLQRQLGTGATGSVWEATDEHLDRVVALKILQPYRARDPLARDRLLREARLTAKIDSPHVMRVFDFTQQDELLIVVAEFIDGPTLKDLHERFGELPVDVIAAVGVQVADALVVLHENGIIHRDLKPSNIMVAPDGVVKLLDLGISRWMDTDETLFGDGEVVGTIPYLAPEQLEGDHGDVRADIYALGIVLWELACGERPFQRDTPAATAFARLQQDLPAPSTSRPGIPEGFDQAVVTACNRDVAARYQSAAAFRADLEPLLDGTSPEELTQALHPDN